MKQINMKFIYLTLIALLPLGLFSQVNTQNSTNSNRLNNAETVRESKFSSLPSFVKFRPSEQFDIDELKQWMTSNFKFAPGIGFELIRQDEDNLGHVHYRYQQTLNGKPIEDAIWIAHTKNDKVYSLNGLIYDKITTTTSASLSESDALSKALEHVGATLYKWQMPEEEAHYKMETGNPNATYQPIAEVVYVSRACSFNAESYRLAYKFNIYAHAPLSRAEIYVDAVTGEIIRDNKLLYHVDTPGVAHTAYSGEKPIIADSFGGTYRLRDGSRGNGIRTFDMNQGTSYGGAVDFIDTDNDWNNINPQKDEYATDAHWGSEMTYDYFFIEHERNSIDNSGFLLNSYVHYDVGYDNAFWDGSRMTYGDGSGFFSPLTSIDVAGHEITHGLTNFTADLVYADESGALNESFSDIFGTAIEQYGRPEDWDWLIGADIGLTGPLRSMSNPNAEGDPDTYFGDFWAPLGGGDAGGVHTNSGVQNFWFYLLTEGGSGTNDNGDAYTVEGLGIESAGDIAFRNLTVYLTSSSQFEDARFYAIQSATDLFGVCTHEVEQTANAWYAVGVGAIYNPETTAAFSSPDTFGCSIPHNVTFENESENAITFEWNFGDGGTSTEENPVHAYTAAGTYTVTLTADGGDCGTDEIVMVSFITVNPDADCIVILPEEGTASTQTSCEGTIYDSGGPGGEYTAGEDSKLTISPFGALNVELTFPFFDVEEGPGATCDYDYLEIFDGPNEFAPLIGRYCNNEMPSDLSSSGSSITLVFHSDGGLELDGFQINWTCNLPDSPPVADFSENSTFSCDGTVYFTDRSTNSPTSWAWDFGDGGTSTEQNPSHTYAANGVYDVTLTATNLIGSGEIIATSHITVALTENPVVTDDNVCQDGEGVLIAEGSEDLNWYEDPTGGVPFFTGNTYTIPELAATTTYYVESHIMSPSLFVGPEDNTFGGGGFFNGDQHLVFNCPTPVILKSVEVYANGSGNRTIELRNSDGSLIESKTVNIPNGNSTVILDFNLPAGTNLQLGTELGSAPNMYRNNTGSPDYPFTLPEGVEIISSSAGLDFYYFFYNWEILTYECLSDRVPVTATIVDCLTIEEEIGQSINLYPNPTGGEITVTTGDLHSGTIQIKDIVGKTIAMISFNSNNFVVDLNQYQANGTYFVTFVDDSGTVISTKRIVKM